jgi:hypothetical protein
MCEIFLQHHTLSTAGDDALKSSLMFLGVKICCNYKVHNENMKGSSRGVCQEVLTKSIRKVSQAVWEKLRGPRRTQMAKKEMVAPRTEYTNTTTLAARNHLHPKKKKSATETFLIRAQYAIEINTTTITIPAAPNTLLLPTLCIWDLQLENSGENESCSCHISLTRTTL